MIMFYCRTAIGSIFIRETVSLLQTLTLMSMTNLVLSVPAEEEVKMLWRGKTSYQNDLPFIPVTLLGAKTVLNYMRL